MGTNKPNYQLQGVMPNTSKAPMGFNGQIPSVQQGRGPASKNKNWPSKYNLKGGLMNRLY